jgi:hypothetical protein
MGTVTTAYNTANSALDTLITDADNALDPVANSGKVNGTLAKVGQAAREAKAALAGGADQGDQLQDRLEADSL